MSSLASLGSQNVGGYSIPVGSGSQLVTLPWGNIDQIKVVFSENVTVAQADLLLSGVNTTAYNVSGGMFSYNFSTFTATWTLPQPIDLDKLLLQLNADGSGPIVDGSGNRLDGEWTNPTGTTQSGSSTYPSGNGTPGGEFLFRFNVLPGDATQDGVVGLADLNTVLSNYGKSGMTWTQGDFTGDAVVGLADLNTVLTNYGLALPSGDPAAESFPAASSSVSAISLAPVTAADGLRAAALRLAPPLTAASSLSSTLPWGQSTVTERAILSGPASSPVNRPTVHDAVVERVIAAPPPLELSWLSDVARVHGSRRSAHDVASLTDAVDKVLAAFGTERFVG